ncbi:MAG: T9SS type A sorting domain-containing protein [Marinoscillum sp.]
MSRDISSTFFKFMLVFFLAIVYAEAFTQVVKVDLNFDGRNESEVHSPAYSSWIISAGQTASFTESSITFEFEAEGFGSGWYKAGAQNPYFAQLASDGLISQDVTLKISGLPPGTHSLLSFHNSFSNPENNTYSNIEIFVGERLLVDDLEQSNRVLDDEDAATAFVEFEVAQGETVNIRFRSEPESEASDKSVYLNGFELNTANSELQPSMPFPADRNEHANADAGEIRLAWKAADEALSHNLYFGQDKEAMWVATPESPEFIWNQTDTSYLISTPGWKPYYWRVDEVYANDTIRGDIWYFIPRRLAFEAAEGYGRHAIGGRGGQVVHVTNLDDDGPGSFREAVTNSIGPRTIVFDVSGLIELESRLTLKDDYVTVAGQTAPGKGITLKGAPFGLSGTSDCIVQNIRVRIGSGPTYDGMGMQGSNYSIIDHCSISWTIDESFSSRSGKNITLQRTLISEALNVAGHQNYPSGTKHGYAASISGDIGSFHHNLLAHCYGRNWSLAGGLDGNGIYAGRLDISNNVVYNFGTRTTDGGAHEVNFVNNYYKPGPGHQGNNYALNAQYDNFPGTQRYYFSGNVMPGHFDESNQESGRRYSGSPQGYSPWVSEPFFDHEINLQTAKNAYKDVLSDVGCISPVFDEHDQRIIEETFNGSYTYSGSKSGIKGMPDSHEDVGGWEDYPELIRPDDWDEDRDGLPNWWEEIMGTEASSASNNNDADGDGFTDLEEFVEWLDHPHHILGSDSVLSLDLAGYTRGYQSSPAYEILESQNIETSLEGAICSVSPITDGLGRLVYRVTDSEGSSREVAVHFAIGDFEVSIPFEREEEEEKTVLEVGSESATIVYPNPVADLIKINSDRDIDSVSVINTKGQQVYSKTGFSKGNVEFNIGHLESGVYFLKIIGPGYEEKIKIAR